LPPPVYRYNLPPMVQPGQFLERPAVIRTADEDVVLEGLYHRGEAGKLPAVIAPPHPLLGGSMDSPVCNELAYACFRTGHPSLRFNFRGVGASRGQVSGEMRDAIEDFSCAIECQIATCKEPRVIACGYSFGSLAAAHLAAEDPRVAAVILVAPPAARMDASAISRISCPGLVVAGRSDSYGPPEKIRELLRGKDNLRFEVIPGADHFFVKGLGNLAVATREWLLGALPA